MADNNQYYQWATSRCAQKEYCRSEIAKKLLAKGATPDEVDDTLGRLEAESYIDEARYARAFVNDKFRFDHWGRIKIRYALRQKGVSDFDTDDALALIDDDDYRQALADFIASRRRTTKGDTPYAVNQKIARAAITRGFEPQWCSTHFRWSRGQPLGSHIYISRVGVIS